MRFKKPVYKFWHLRVMVLIILSLLSLSLSLLLLLLLSSCNVLYLCFFLLVRIPRPVSVKQLEHTEDEDGISDEHINKRNPAFQK